MPELTFLQAISRGIWEEMEADKSVFLMGEDIGRYGGAFRVTEGFLDKFGPDGVIETPLAEEGFVGAAIGAAYVGLRPVVEFQFIDFIACAFDPIVNFACTSRYRWGQGVPVTFRGPWGGATKAGPVHPRNIEMWFAHSPGIKVIVVHEDTRTGGIAGEIAAIVNEEAFEHLDGRVVRVTAPDTPVPSAPSLEEAFLPSVKDIVEAARKLAAY